MALPNVTINLENGNLGRIAQSDDGVAGLILTGAAVSDKLALNEVYLCLLYTSPSPRDA